MRDWGHSNSGIKNIITTALEHYDRICEIRLKDDFCYSVTALVVLVCETACPAVFKLSLREKRLKYNDEAYIYSL